MKKTRKILCTLMAVLMVLMSAPLAGVANLDFGIEASAADLEASGSCGENVNYTYDSSTGELTIKGSGKMKNYGYSSSSPFYNSNIKSVVIESGVTSIGKYAFYYCRSLTSVTIPDSVTSIGDYAFYGCNSVTSVTIPDSVTSIGDYAFYGCNSLTGITVDSNNTEYSSDSYGVLFNKDKTDLIQYPSGNKRTSYTIPDGVKYIYDFAFDGCTSLTSVIIPDSVTIIDRYAFNNCASLISVTIGNSVTSIGDKAFAYCTSLKSITIPNNVTNIGSYTFYECTSLKSITIPDNVTRIGSYAFYCCTSLESVTIPNNVTSIGSYAFYECTSLKSVTIPDNVTSIGTYAFRDCESLASVTIPDSVTSIDSGAFYNTAYYNNEDNWVDGVLYIGKYLIDAKTSITSCDIKDGTLCIVADAFRDCESLASVTIPDSVTSIDSGAFRDCESLASITIGDSVTSIGKDAFYGTAYCNNKDNWENGVLYIGKYLIEADESITSCDIKDGILYIATYAFRDCESLASVTIPDSVTSIDVGTFLYCASLESVAVDKNNEYYSSDDSGVLFNKDKTELIQYPIGSTRTSYGIPDGVISIGESTFSNCKHLESVTISNSVTGIGDGAFFYCTSLESATIGDSVKSIGLGAFMMCNTLASITIGDSVTSIGEGAFFYCTSLSSVTIGNSVTSIGEMAFSYCDSLTDVYYNGSESDWNNIVIASDNGPLTSATIHYTEEDDHTHTNADPVKENEVSSTCQKAGSYDEVIYCTECGKEVSRKTITLSKLDHNYTTTQVDATCTKDGSITYTCTCGDTYTDTISATGHKLGSWYISTPATVFADGEEKCDCANCNYYETRKLDKLTNDTAKDETSGVGITYTADSFEEVPTVVVSENNEEMENANFVLGCFGKFKAFSISIEVDGEKVQPNGKVTVKLPIPAGYDAASTQAYYVNENNEMIKLDCYIKGGYLIFETDHFSVYAIVDESTEIHIHNYEISAQVEATCTKDGSITYTCVCGDSYSEPIPVISHIDSNADAYCDVCGTDLNPQAHCTCNCHKTGIVHFFFVIANFFEKLFGNNKVCACGAIH